MTIEPMRFWNTPSASTTKHMTLYPCLSQSFAALACTAGLRVFEHDPKQRYDVFDNKPFSTDFTFTRFLVPALNQYQGMALFMDSDMFVRGDIEGIFGVYGNRTDFAVQCVKHKYEPPEGAKMDGVAQTAIAERTGLALCYSTAPTPATKSLPLMQ